MQKIQPYIGFKRGAPESEAPHPSTPAPRAEKRLMTSVLYCNSFAKQANGVDSRECEPSEVQPWAQGAEEGARRAAFSYIRIKHQMLSTSREQVKRRGNTDERGRENTLGK